MNELIVYETGEWRKGEPRPRSGRAGLFVVLFLNSGKIYRFERLFAVVKAVYFGLFSTPFRIQVISNDFPYLAIHHTNPPEPISGHMRVWYNNS